MIEVRVFATLRQGRDKVTLLSPEGIACAGDILDRMNIPQEEVSFCSSTVFITSRNRK